jgi:hypothetical protein
MTSEPATTAVRRRACGCVAEAGHPDCAAEIRRSAKSWGEAFAVVPTAEFRALPWACPKCDVGEAAKAERGRWERVAAEAVAEWQADIAAGSQSAGLLQGMIDGVRILERRVREG